MNNNHSDNELNYKMIYKKRLIGPLVKSAIKSFSVIIISGARQVGKSTFLRNEFPDFKYINLDDFSTLEQAKIDPYSLWIGSDKIIIDEVQKAPEILSAVKLTVDTTNRTMRFLLSGSSNLLLMKNISESLAGRAIYFEMYPFTYGEIIENTSGERNFSLLLKENFKVDDQTLEVIDPLPFIFKGFMPPLIHINNERDILLWWESYIKTYIERDLRDLSQIESLIDFKKVMDSLAIRTGNILNQTGIAQDSGISQPTVYRYIKLLEVSNIIKRVPGYFSSKSKRVFKSPKIFFIDPALAVYLTGYYSKDQLENANEVGRFFETMVFLHLQVYAQLMNPKGNIFYWRAFTGKEVDFVLEQGRKIFIFEVKFTKNPTYNDIKNMQSFIEDHPETVRGILIYAGDSIRWMHSKIVAIPWYWIG